MGLHIPAATRPVPLDIGEPSAHSPGQTTPAASRVDLPIPQHPHVQLVESLLTLIHELHEWDPERLIFIRGCLRRWDKKLTESIMQDKVYVANVQMNPQHPIHLNKETIT